MVNACNGTKATPPKQGDCIRLDFLSDVSHFGAPVPALDALHSSWCAVATAATFVARSHRLRLPP